MEKVVAVLYCADLFFLISFQFLNRDYGVFSHAVSDYGVGPTATLFKFYVVLGSLAAPALAFQFWTARHPAYPEMISVYLLLVMVGRLGIGLFPNDLRGAARTTSGQIHHAATLLGATCAFMVVTEATPLLTATVGAPLSNLLSGLKYLIGLAFLATMITRSPALHRFFGLTERIFLYAAALWCLLASLALPPI